MPPVRRTWAPKGQTPILPCAGSWTKISAISAIRVSLGSKRIALYIRFHPKINIRADQVLEFLRYLRRHLRKGFVLLWDGGAFHRAGKVKRFLKKHPSIRAYTFPAYAPELNPDEFVWAQMKRSVANGVPYDTDHLRQMLGDAVGRIKRSKKLLWSCVHAAELKL